MPGFRSLALLSADSHPTRKAYKAMGDHYSWWIMLPQEDFSRIVDPSDQAFTLLAANCTCALNPESLSQPCIMVFPAHLKSRISRQGY